MPMIDVYAAAGTFADKHALAQQLAAAVIRWEQVPDIALFRDNTAAFIHDLEADSLSTVAGDSDRVRVQVLTPVGVLDRDKHQELTGRSRTDGSRRGARCPLSHSVWVPGRADRSDDLAVAKIGCQAGFPTGGVSA
jgi:hypothetical protein